MEDIKQLMQHQFLTYASYVIRERAVPDAYDGLKPVQRRILYTLMQMHDGKLHKVANVAGQTMALHPHGDAPIVDALVNIATKGFLLDTQGNFGNILTGDPAAAARYIETRLSPLAKETLFNADLTETIPSYDGRHQEPIVLPAKIPVVLMQGADGIAVGMSTRIFPHNFVELLEAEIAILEERPFLVLPDFPTGGIMDASQYDKGRGKIKLRAKIEVRDAKSLIIREICYGTTTESLMHSIEEAAKKGKIKIDSIHDYTSDKVEIELKLPRGHYAQDLIDALYAYTECEVPLTSQIVVIKDKLPWETDVDSLLHLQVEKLQEYIRRELEIEQQNLLERIFEKTLEQIFIENRLYKPIEKLESYEAIHQNIAENLEPFHSQLLRVPTEADRERLLNIPIRRISRFDINKNQDEIIGFQHQLTRVDKELKSIKKVAIRYLEGLIKKHGKDFPRKTEIQEIQQVDKRAMETKAIQVYFDSKTGFIGTKVTGNIVINCTNFDKLFIAFKDGTYQVINIPEKLFIQKGDSQVIYAGVADKQTAYTVVYQDAKTHLVYGKRFVIAKFLVDKSYSYLEDKQQLVIFSAEPSISLDLIFIPKVHQKTAKVTVKTDQILVKGVSSKGVRLSPKPIKKVVLLSGGTGGS